MTGFRRAAAASLSTLAAVLIGCGGDRPQMGQVEGTVSYKGQPVPNGTITFIPDKGRSASGVIEDGAIKNVTCFEANDGVPVGPAKVIISAFSKQPEGSTAPTKALLPEKYSSPERTDQKADIKPGKNDLKFDLQ